MRKRLYSFLLFLGAIAGVAKAQDVTIPVSGIESGWGWSCTFADTLNPNKTAGVGCDSTNVKKINIGSYGSWALRKLPAVDWSTYGSIELLVYTISTVNFSPKISYKGWNNTTGNVEIKELDAKVDNKQLTKNEWQVITIDISGPYVDKNGKTYASLSDTSLNLNTIQLGMQCDTAEIYVGAITIKAGATTKEVNIPISSVRNGWGWNNTIEYGVANPGSTTGIGCDASSVTKVSLTIWGGSFGIQDTTGVFSWGAIANLACYKKLEMLVYPSLASEHFNDSVLAIGYKDSNIVANASGVDTNTLVANQWQKVTIDLTNFLTNDKNSDKKYTSIGDSLINIMLLQFKALNLGAESGEIYIGSIVLTDFDSSRLVITIPAEDTVVPETVSIPLNAVRNGWGWNNSIAYNTENPNRVAGLGCGASSVTKVSISGWNGSFGIQDTTGVFAWSKTKYLSKYHYLEILVYPSISENFNDSVKCIGYNNGNIQADLVGLENKKLIAEKWQKVYIDLTKQIKDKSNTYTSIEDANLGLSLIQLGRLNLTKISGDIYIGSIVLTNRYDSTVVVEDPVNDISLPLNCIRNGWGWNNTISYKVSNPNSTAGTGCDSSKVTQVSLSGWCGSFGIQDTVGYFSWKDVKNLDKYKSIELLVFPTNESAYFNDSVMYIGYNKRNVVGNAISLESKTLTGNEWQILHVDLTHRAIDKDNSSICYSSFADTAIGLSLIQLKTLRLGAETGDLYIGGVTLSTKSFVVNNARDISSDKNISVYPNPAKNSFNISAANDGTYSLRSISGVEVSAGRVTEGKSTVDVSKLAPGLYLLSVSTINGVETQKVFVK